jgi:hypothetical protein
MRWRSPRQQGVVERAGLKRPSDTTEAYFRTDSPAERVLVVYHLQKTAGTSLRRFVRANLPPAEVEIAPDLQRYRYQPDELLRWYGEWYEALDADRRERLCCLMSHSAGYLLPALDRPPDTVVLVREPVDRVLSFYGYKRANYYRRRAPDAPFPELADLYATSESERTGRPQNLESWHQFSNWQSRSLLSVFHDVSGLPFSSGPTPDAELWRGRLRELLDRVYLVGVQDRFEAFVEQLSERFGWQPLVAHSKVNAERTPLAETPASLRETVLAHNWLDAELYELARQAQDRRG